MKLFKLNIENKDMFVDVHCHLDLMEDVEEVIKRAKEKGVVRILTAGLDLETNKKTIELAKKYDVVKPVLGYYPESTDKVDVEFIKKNKPIAIGEVGLDFLNDNPRQEEKFLDMIKLAKEMKLPLVIHSRKAEEKVLDILEREGVKKVLMHCFCGKKKLIERAVKNKYYFSVPPNIVRAQNFQELVKIVPMNYLLTETDSPYLGPVKDERNEPANVTLTVEKIAEIKGLDEEEVKKNIFMNYMNLFE